MAKTPLTPEQAQAAAKAEEGARKKAEAKAKADAKVKAEQEAKENKEAAKQGEDIGNGDAGTGNEVTNPTEEKPKDGKKEKCKISVLDEKLKHAFENFPTADKLYHDGEEVYFVQVKPNMTIIKRADFCK
jgi:membrane protein involved in colicin uptake